MSNRNVADLHTNFQPMVKELIRQGNMVMPTGVTFFITDGYRSLTEQTILYNQGRTTPGKIVTNAQAGESPHNFGLAVDCAFQKDGKLLYDAALYAKVYPIARSLGFILGADWSTFKDNPHFEMPNWRSVTTPATPTTEPQSAYRIEPHTRNVIVTAERGVKVRENPTTTSTVKSVLSVNANIAVVGFTESEKVDGNAIWWKTSEGFFVWSGATNIIPSFPTVEKKPVVADVFEPELSAAQRENILAENKALRSDVSRLNEAGDLVVKENDQLKKNIEELRLKLADAIKDPTNSTALRVANDTLSNQIEVYKEKVRDQKLQLNTARVQAFNGWSLVGVRAGILGLFQYPVICVKLLALMIQGLKTPYVLGWKVGGRIVQVGKEDQNTPPQLVEKYTLPQ